MEVDIQGQRGELLGPAAAPLDSAPPSAASTDPAVPLFSLDQKVIAAHKEIVAKLEQRPQAAYGAAKGKAKSNRFSPLAAADEEGGGEGDIVVEDEAKEDTAAAEELRRVNVMLKEYHDSTARAQEIAAELFGKNGETSEGQVAAGPSSG